METCHQEQFQRQTCRPAAFQKHHKRPGELLAGTFIEAALSASRHLPFAVHDLAPNLFDNLLWFQEEAFYGAVSLLSHWHGPENCFLSGRVRLAGTFGSPVQYKEPRRIISSVQLLSRVRLCDPMNCSTPGLPVHHQLPAFTQTHAHRVGDAIQHLILCRPLLLLPPIP